MHCEQQARSLEERIARVGADLGRTLGAVLGNLPGNPVGTMAVARALGIDKVLSSRVLKAVRCPDPMALVHQVPGPEPLRRLLKAARSRGVDRRLVSEATAAVDAFDSFVRTEMGDRGSLDAMITAWVPELRRPFELSRKQAAFKAMSQLRGAAASTNLTVAVVNPSKDGKRLDVAWVYGILGLQRMRPGVPLKFANRNISKKPLPGREARTLSGDLVSGFGDLHLEQFCSKPLPSLDAIQGDECIRYVMTEGSFGPGSCVDIVFADMSVGEMRRYSLPDQKVETYLFAETAVSAKSLVFDVFLGEEVYPASSPELHVYDTAIEGLARINDPAREVDRLDFLESIQPMGKGIDQCRLGQYPRYTPLLHHVFEKLGWDPSSFRGFRCAIDYPIYGSQVAMAFEAPPPPKEDAA